MDHDHLNYHQSSHQFGIQNDNGNNRLDDSQLQHHVSAQEVIVMDTIGQIDAVASSTTGGAMVKLAGPHRTNDHPTYGHIDELGAGLKANTRMRQQIVDTVTNCSDDHLATSPPTATQDTH